MRRSLEALGVLRTSAAARATTSLRMGPAVCVCSVSPSDTTEGEPAHLSGLQRALVDRPEATVPASPGTATIPPDATDLLSARGTPPLVCCRASAAAGRNCP